MYPCKDGLKALSKSCWSWGPYSAYRASHSRRSPYPFGSFRGAYEPLLPEFEKTSTVKITTTMDNIRRSA